MTDLDKISQTIDQIKPENILCVLSTTSCFAPRIPDDVVSIGKMCLHYNLPYCVNNAYGLQCSKIMFQLNLLATLSNKK